MAEEGSFTRAGRQLGLTQSAVSRQIQQLEEEVGTELLSRTTRRAELTEAGGSFLKAALRITSDLEDSLKQFREAFTNQPPVVKVGISHSISHAHLPGLLKHFWRSNPGAKLDVVYNSSEEVIEELTDRRIDVGIISSPAKALGQLNLAHSFEEEFVPIAPEEMVREQKLSWLTLDATTRSGALISEWLDKSQSESSGRVTLPNFDLIITLVGIGVGRGVVPKRALRTYGRHQAVKEIPCRKSLTRQIGIFTRANSTSSRATQSFINSILFGWKNPSS